MEEVLKQAPSDLDREFIQTVFLKNNQNVLDTLSELWNIKPIDIKQKTKWEDIRDTCDSFDIEMQKLFKKPTKK
jgi:hypothetical protein